MSEHRAACVSSPEPRDDTCSFLGLPGASVVKNPPANAGDTGSIPSPGSFHILWSNKRSLCATTAESVPQSPATREAAVMRNFRTARKSSFHSLQLEKILRSSEDPAQPKRNKYLKNKLLLPYSWLQWFSPGGDFWPSSTPPTIWPRLETHLLVTA